jgi:hypothetical protein
MGGKEYKHVDHPINTHRNTRDHSLPPPPTAQEGRATTDQGGQRQQRGLCLWRVGRSSLAEQRHTEVDSLSLARRAGRWFSPARSGRQDSSRNFYNFAIG